MAIIDDSLEAEVANTSNKEMVTSLNTASERTVSLAEDERKLFEDDLSQLTDEFASSMKNADDDGISSCTPMPSRIKFAPMASLYPTISLDEYTQDEIEDTFWTPKQMEVLNKAHKRTVERMEAGLEEKSSTPYRGMEQFTVWGYRRCLIATNAYFNTVMDEMDRQRKDSEKVSWDWEEIASLTEKLTKKSAQQAIKIALSDENEARAAYKSIEAAGNRTRQSKSFSAYFRKARAGLSHLATVGGTSKIRKPVTAAGRKTSKDRKRMDRLESFIRIAEGHHRR